MSEDNLKPAYDDDQMGDEAYKRVLSTSGRKPVNLISMENLILKKTNMSRRERMYVASRKYFGMKEIINQF